jgi:hypothetical protein
MLIVDCSGGTVTDTCILNLSQGLANFRRRDAVVVVLFGTGNDTIIDDNEANTD